MILIIGAGITGLTSASCINGKTLIVERDNEVGGYCRTTKRNGFIWDRSGHFFHFKNSKVKDFFKNNIPQQRFAEVNKKTSIYFSDYGNIDFPFQKNIHQLPKNLYINCLVDLYMAENECKNYSTFKEFVYSTMGASIAKLFLVPYNEKLYACDLDDLDHGAMGRFFPQATFKDILVNARLNDNASYNDTFSYPLEGAEEFVQVLHQYAEKSATIRLNTSVLSIDIHKKEAILSDGTVIKYTYLINTAPLDAFCNLSKIDTNNISLTSNKVAVFNLGFDRKNNYDKHWVYFPGNEVFYRVGCYHNIRSDDRASLYVEIGLKREQSPNKEILLKQVLVDLKAVGIIDEEFKLIDYEFVIMDPAYVHINEKSNDFKTQLKKYLKKNNTHTIGRYGNWTYCSIEDNMLEARNTVKNMAEHSSSTDSSFSFNDIFQGQ